MEYVEFTGSSLSNEKCIRTRRGNAGRGSENSCCSVAAIQLHVNDTRLEKQSNALLGLYYYMKQAKCDLVIGAIGMTVGRYTVMDFVEGYAYTSIAIMIPMPQELQNVDAALLPFQFSVWIALVVIMPITAVAIYYFSRPLNFKKPADESVTIAGSPEKGVCSETNSKISKALFQIFRVLMSQGGTFRTIRPALYFVVGSWCLGAMVLISAYNSILTSYILGSNAKPLVDSALDVVGNSNVNIAVNKGNGVDLVLSAAEVGFYKQAGDKVSANPKSRCETTGDCVNLVKLGSYAYLHSMFTAIDIINEDYKATGACHLAIARQLEAMPGSLAWVLPKNSPYSTIFSIGFMELHEAGLIDHWTEWELMKYKNATYCLQEALKRQQRKAASKKETKITLKNFSGPFDLLILGYLISFILFVREIVHFKVKSENYDGGEQRRRRKRFGISTDPLNLAAIHYFFLSFISAPSDELLRFESDGSAKLLADIRIVT
ncbi:hypothetical protein OUZ56_024985 [Daphnia magna]|uniref:Ionotropic glutamate receptor C-terminal domain-containing protein n=1 Tax=Daphnia magna TaxID=35525 RepID=A0ABQ9ZIK0_9CRUS|nr:hypothetical protein OUZ56_024985 [Daphnia magna]